MKYFGLMPEETEAYRKLVKYFGLVPITELLTGLIDPTNKMQPLNDWSTKKLVCFSGTYIFFRCIRG